MSMQTMAQAAKSEAPDEAISTYTHEALDTTKQQIRLIRLHRRANNDSTLHCSMATFDIDTAPEYIALSYVWGEPLPRQAILVNGSLLYIRQNLFDFLSVYCNDDTNDSYLWIDQITIDQSSNSERNHQVQLMSIIYKRCKYVIAWLGVSAQRPAEEFLLGPCFYTANDLLQNRYFTRLWIVQELLLSPEVRIMCGTAWIDMVLLANIVVTTVPGRIITSTVWLFSAQRRPRRSWTLEQSIRGFTRMDCQDPRDKVYGMSGLLPEDERPHVDYDKRVPEVYIDVINKMEELAQGVHWEHPSARMKTYIQLARDMGVEDEQRSQLSQYFSVVLWIDSQANANKRLQLGFERADLGAGTPDRWWYGHDGQKRRYFPHEPPTS